MLCLLALGSVARAEGPVAPQIHPVPDPIQLRLPDSPQPSPGTLTADAAARLALAQQPELRQFLDVALAAGGQTAQARAGLFPNINASSTYSRLYPLTGGTIEGTGNPAAGGGGSQAQVQLRQLLWDFNRTDSVVGRARYNQLAAEADYIRARADVVLDVKTAFYNWVALRDQAEVEEANLINQRHNLELARARWESGLGLPADMVQAQTAVAAGTVSLNRARAAALTAQVQLARKLGMDPRTPLEADLTATAVAAVGDLNRQIEEALPRRPELVVAEARVQAAEYALTAAERNDWPSLYGTAGPVARGSDFPPDNVFMQVGVQFAWPLFDGGYTGGLVDQARAELDSAHAAEEALRIQLVGEILQAAVELQTAQASLAAAESETANATEAVRIAEGRYKAGIGQFQDVLDTQAALLAAQTHLVEARRVARVAQAAFERALGLGLAE